jgi:hypothetical protein
VHSAPAAILVKACAYLAVAVVLLLVAQQVATVKVTVLEDGRSTQVAVDGDDPVYREEIRSAKKKAIPFYAASVIAGLIGLALLRKSYRAYRRRREA